MAASSYPNPNYPLPLSFLCIVLILLPSVNPISQYNNLVYKHCKNKTLMMINPNDQPRPYLLSSLFREIVAQSSQSKFFKTNIGDELTAISGRFRCREDLSNGDCHSCVEKLPQLSSSLCGDAIPARVQLSGCYIHYEEEEDEGTASSPYGPRELLHKSCSEYRVERGAGGGLEELREAAFGALQNGVVEGSGFCEMKYEGMMHLMGQCEGSLGGCECGKCVSYAAQVAEEECGYSVSGQVYLRS